MIRAVLVDDEKNNIDNLQGLLEKYCPQVNVIGFAKNGKEGKVVINELKPELLFLDIQMPEMNGFELLQSLNRRDFEVIFVTAYDQYGIQAVKFSAIDYLLKPVDVDELKVAVEKAIEKNNSRKENFRLENLLSYLQHKDKRKEHRLALPISKETRFVNPHDIIRCESSNNYTHFYLEGGEKIIVSRPIFEYEEILADYDFIRCHQSYLVNKLRVKSWVKEDGSYLLLDDGTKIPVSRKKKEAVVKALTFPGM